MRVLVAYLDSQRSFAMMMWWANAAEIRSIQCNKAKVIPLGRMLNLLE